MKAIAGPSPASGLSVAILRPGCTASRGVPTRSPSAAAVSLEVLHPEREPPEPRRPVGIARHARALGRLHHLEDRLADAEERLPRRAAGRLALAHAAQLEALRAQVLRPSGRGRATSSPRDRPGRRRSGAAPSRATRRRRRRASTRRCPGAGPSPRGAAARSTPGTRRPRRRTRARASRRARRRSRAARASARAGRYPARALLRQLELAGRRGLRRHGPRGTGCQPACSRPATASRAPRARSAQRLRAGCLRLAACERVRLTACARLARAPLLSPLELAELAPARAMRLVARRLRPRSRVRVALRARGAALRSPPPVAALGAHALPALARRASTRSPRPARPCAAPSLL